ncbi:hypothetical protein AB0C76_04940 [Kitasatospora sp. NPDC048722]|uniref:hypothetical protein n=1 Tax=Kitasatospora sp. NPDC048722 TaxID=3155639 RepID=UPI0033CAB449
MIGTLCRGWTGVDLLAVPALAGTRATDAERARAFQQALARFVRSHDTGRAPGSEGLDHDGDAVQQRLEAEHRVPGRSGDRREGGGLAARPLVLAEAGRRLGLSGSRSTGEAGTRL